MGERDVIMDLPSYCAMKLACSFANSVIVVLDDGLSASRRIKREMNDFSLRRDGKTRFVIGNARQLENDMIRLVASVRGKAIEGEHLDFPREEVETRNQEKKHSFNRKTVDAIVDEIEHRVTDDALKKHDWNRQKTAQALGLSRQGLAKMLKRFGIMA